MCVCKCTCSQRGQNGEREVAWREWHGNGESFLVNVQYAPENKRAVGGSESNSIVLGLTPWNKQGDDSL